MTTNITITAVTLDESTFRQQESIGAGIVTISLFNKDTGLLETTYSGAERSAPVASELQIIVNGIYSPTEYLSLEGDIKALPSKPGLYYQFDRATESWVSVGTPDLKAAEIRSKRDKLLAESDWSQLPDVPDSLKEKYISYRQALRNITEQITFPEFVIWPTLPV
jgi:hypothetical protein